ncbi:MAG: ABC transporter permease [Deltaproteobacteria bacterium]|nr:ABC transporter permease [Deltaproteobacteria bacterium]
MGNRLWTGAQHALVVVVAQVALLYLLAAVPTGTRAQATGVAVTSLAMLVSGFILGFRFRHGPGATLNGSKGAQRLLELREIMAPWKGAPWPEVLATAAVLAAVGLVAQFLGLLDGALPPAVVGEGGMARAAFATDSVGGFAYVAIGAMLGVNHRPGTTRAAGLGVVIFAAVVAVASEGARYASYDGNVIAALRAVGVLVTAWLTGFVLAWVRRRLAFVEQVMVALLVGYTLFLVAAIGPTFAAEGGGGVGGLLVGFMDGLLSPLQMVPQEQILLGLAVFPTVALVSLMTVGGSQGFLLHGGGRFDPGFGMEAQIALRYLKAHRRDGFVGIVTIIAVVGVCLGVMALIVVLSVMSGFENDLKMKILGAHAHIVVGKRGDDFTEYEEVEAQVRQVDGVSSAVAFVLGDAMISTDVGLSGTLVKGVDASDPEGVAELRRTVEQGSFDDLLHPENIPGARPRLTFPPPPVRTSTPAVGQPIMLDQPAIREPTQRRILPGILIGRELSKTLRAYVGDTVKLVSPSSDEIGPLGPTPKLRRFRVAGVFYSGMYEYDAKFTYIDMKQAQRFFGLRKEATGVEVKLADVDETARIAEEVKRRVGGHPYTVKDWRAMNKELFSALLLEKLAMFIALGMIVTVASFLIVAVLVMIVLQRKREIAILKSLGSSDASIMKIFVVQGLIIGVGGALLGGLIGVGICLFVEKFGVELDPRIFYIERLPVVMDWGEISAIAVAAVIISYLATIYPAVTAALHPPVEGLRDD